MCLPLKKRRLMKESLPHDVVEEILERLPVRSLVRFKSVSKQWKSTIQSRRFQERQLKQREEWGGDPEVVMVTHESVRTLVLGGSRSRSPAVKIPSPWGKEKTEYLACYNSCDGLVCLYRPRKPGFVLNPATRWYRPLPLCQFQQLMISQGESYFKLKHGLFKLGFGKDVSTYKPVWLYNSAEIGLEGATTCEVFDFTTNAWRYVTPSSPYRVVGLGDPVFVGGSLHWFTDCQETKIISFDLHTEAFQVVSKAPFASNHPYDMVLCNLDNRLCVSQKLSSNQVIWSFNSGNKTWDKFCSIDLDMTSVIYDCPKLLAFRPLALLDGKKKMKKKKKDLLFYDCVQGKYLFIHDHVTEPDDVAFMDEYIGFVVCYFPSLISI